MKKAMIGMSGGVDSSVAAFLTQQAGFQCIGATMRLFSNDALGEDQQSTCCSLDDVEDARSVCRRMGIPHYAFNFQDDFRSCVMEKFVRCYEAGQTPSPCIDCNRYLKFGKLLQRARELERQGLVCIIAPDSTEGMSTLTKNRAGLEKMYAKGKQDAEALVRWMQNTKQNESVSA